MFCCGKISIWMFEGKYRDETCVPEKFSIRILRNLKTTAYAYPWEEKRPVIYTVLLLGMGSSTTKRDKAFVLHAGLVRIGRLHTFKILIGNFLARPIFENDRGMLYWDPSIIPDRTMVANKPDNVVVDICCAEQHLVTSPFRTTLLKP
ncbi:hypothetical protein O3G_MSEX002825 [Manduca sexta]|uniref:Uncharacterized protein n=1 Tax=Manduca sexta TaxID=7130 RepID=A0A922CFG8_MANSE|nr:hypothetical protein O3G_MSEX002825 [Manduca sexta]